jgi:NAD/NADP transhydrogenase beta subunit
MPEFIRKFIVALKRKPQNIALFAVIVSFVWYSFNLKVISFTTTRLQGNNMGLTGFAIMLFSTLAIVCCLNAFPYRKKVNKPMLVLLFLMIGIVLFCDIHYLNCIADKLASGIITEASLPEVVQARDVMRVHIILLAVSTFLIVTLPVYRKALRKINTSVEVEENGEMGAIDISGE